MGFFREWTSLVTNRKGRMVPVETIGRLLELHDPGYASVYMFEEDAAKAIADSGASRNMDQYPVAADCLTIDIDSGEDGLRQATERLHRAGLAFEVWASGGKGFHIVIPHQLEVSEHLPYSHLKAVEALGVKDYDPTLYQHGRLISLPGRVHPKTRKKKRLVYAVDGGPLELKIFEKPDLKFAFNGERANLDALTSGLMRFVYMTTNEPRPGTRHTSLWGASKDLAEAGLSFETVLDLAERTNETWDQPKAPEEVRQAVAQAFKMPTGSSESD